MLAKKENFLDKIVKKDYQNELEKILEEKKILAKMQKVFSLVLCIK